jgi:hypothetical protein
MLIKSYLIDITIDEINLKYNGDVSIIISDDTDMNEIIINSINMNIHDVFINDNKVGYTYDQRNIYVKYKFNRQQDYNIKITFDNNISSELVGLYYSTYEDKKIKKQLISTQFESIYCRNFIPCFDDPQLKSRFKIILTGNPKLTYLSNMNIEKEENVNNLKKTYFYTTPLMSSYLLCVVIGELSKKTMTTKSGITVNSYNYLNNDDLKIALEKTVSSLEYFEDYFKIKYPLPKLDIVPIPNFSSAAMENWGLVTFRETSLFINRNTSDYERLMIIETIHHEIAHQWFGNLVTMKSWNDLWLNESIATYFSFCAMIDLEKEYYPENFIIERYKSALMLDALSSTHPIMNTISHDQNVDEIFDDITYSKGASIMMFLAKYLGKKKFNQNIIDYLNKYAYQNTTTYDFINMFSGIDDIFRELIITKNYPILRITRKNNKITLESLKFILNKDILDKFNVNYKIEYFKSGVKSYINLNEIKEIPITRDDTFYISPSDNGLIILDYNFINENDKSIPYLPIKLFSLKDLIYICETEYILFLSNIKPIYVILKLYEYVLKHYAIMSYRVNYNLIKIVCKNMSDILSLEKLSLERFDYLDPSRSHEQGLKKKEKILNDCYRIESYLYNILIKTLDTKVLFHQEIIGTILKILVVNFNNENAISIAVRLFDKYLAEYKVNDSFYLCEHIFSVMIQIDNKHKNLKYFDIINSIGCSTNNIFIKKNAEFSLLCIYDTSKLSYIIDNIFSLVKLQDIPRYIRLLLKNKYIRYYTLDFIIKHIDKIKQFSEKQSVKIFRQIKENLYDDDFVDRLIDLINKNFNDEILKSSDNVFRQILERLLLNKSINKTLFIS